MQAPVESWGVKEVCDWVEHLGLGQYRKRFLHHSIAGPLLLQLTETHLKVEYCIKYPFRDLTCHASVFRFCRTI